MSQNKKTGRNANEFGYRMAKVVADELGLELIRIGTSNKCKGPKGIGIIKSARTSSYIGIIKTMLPELKVIYAVVKNDENTYDVYEIQKAEFENYMFEPSAEKNKHMWFMKVRDIKSFRPIIKVVDSDDTVPKKIMTQHVVFKKIPVPSKQVETRIQELFKVYNDLLGELRDLKVIRSANNPAGDYGEYLAENKLGLIQAPKSSKGYDLTDSIGKKYQVKTRRLTPHNKSRQLGGFRDLDEKLFDSCVAIILTEDFKLDEMWEIPHEMICKYARNTTRGFKRVVLDGKLLQEVGVKQLY